jgi:hypothetical protein
MLGGSGWSPGVMDALREQVFADRTAMSSGVLVGVRHLGAIRVDAVIPSVTGSRSSTDPLDHASWGYIHETLGRTYPGREVVGWYVARPNLNGAVTEVDVALHQRFFPGHQVLLAIDPRSGVSAAYGSVPGGVTELHRGRLDYEEPLQSLRRFRPTVPRSSLRRPALLGAVAGAVIWIAAGADAGVLG